jgi:two-component system OmpR family sensor kinase/two-component system sensor histidine kinase BaeS
LFLAAIVIVLALAFGPPQLWLSRPRILLWIACGVPLVFFTLVSLMGGLAFHRIGTPLADVMAAVEAVAEGDFTIRLREGAPGELGRLARSFNRMTAELARAEQQRRNLTADVAHELRTPLHIIQGNLEGILDGVYEPTPEHIAATLEETRMLARLVSDLQTLSLAEAGQLPLHPVSFPVAGLLSDVAASFSGQAAEAGVEIRVAMDNGFEIAASPIPQGENSPAHKRGQLELYADIDRLDQVLSNLVANALRHTPQGGQIVLRAAEVAGGVRLEVHDTGSGISAEDIPFIFDRFWRGDRARARGAGAGSGLGLAISKQLVQASGGRIEVESQPGLGTTFRIEFQPKDRA